MPDEITQVVSVSDVDAQPPNRRLFARLGDVPLADLVQLNGQRSERSVLCVTSGTQQGELFFEAGRLHAAQFEESTGLEALARMLRLERGVVRACEHAWPATGNLRMEPVAALLRAANFRFASEPNATALAVAQTAAEPFPLRTVDSMVLDDPSAPDHEPDVALARLGESFYGRCRRLGRALGLARLDSARLTADAWIFLLFHDAKTNRLSAVLGARTSRGVPAPTASAGASPGSARATSLPTSLAELAEQPGIIAAFMGDATGKALASSHSEALRPSQLADATALSSIVLDCARDIGLEATAAELRFAGRRLLLQRSGERSVGLLAVSSVRAAGLRELTRHLARSLAASQVLGEPDAASTQPVIGRSLHQDQET